MVLPVTAYQAGHPGDQGREPLREPGDQARCTLVVEAEAAIIMALPIRE